MPQPDARTPDAASDLERVACGGLTKLVLPLAGVEQPLGEARS